MHRLCVLFPYGLQQALALKKKFKITLTSILHIMANIIVNYTKCLAKVSWQCKPGEYKQCSRNSKQGDNLCGIHLLKNPHGLVVSEVPDEAAAPDLAALPVQAPQEKLVSHGAASLEDTKEEDQLADLGAAPWGLLDTYGQEALSNELPKEEEEQGTPSPSFDDAPNIENSDCHAKEEHHESLDGDEFSDGSDAGGVGQLEVIPIDSDSDPEPVQKKLKMEPGLADDHGVRCEFNFDHIADHMQMAQSKNTAFNMSQLRRYSDFCVQFPKEMVLEDWKPLVCTKVGPVFLEEEMLKTFLVNLRFCGQPISAEVLPQGSVKQLVAVLFALQAGLKECLFQDLPPWVHGQSKSVALLFRKWKRDDMCKEHLSTRKTSITPSQIEDWCIAIILKDMMGEASLIEIEQALLLRLQSGRSHRFVNISALCVGDIGYQAAASGGESVPFFNITNTKPTGTLSMEGLSKAKGKVQLLVVDPVTQHLWHKWVNQPGSLCWTPSTFFFPKQGAKDFSWNEPLPRHQHNKAVQDCALQLGIPITVEELQKFTSKSVRVGVSCDVSRAVRSVLVDSNQKQGRAPGSKVDLSTYTPKDVLMEPGPIFANTQDIRAKLEGAIADHFNPIKANLCCASCGFPACGCKECNKPAGQKKRVGHSCWLLGKSGRTPAGGPSEDEGQKAARASAWQAFCIDGVPQWCNGEYSW